MSSSKGGKQEFRGEDKMLTVEREGYRMREESPVYMNAGGNRDLSSYIRNSLTRLDMLIFLDRKEEAQAEIQEISQQLKRMGI